LARRSTTSPATSNRAPRGNPDPLRRLIEALPKERLDRVFTHPNWVHDRLTSYERLEFLGDSVLELAIAHELYDTYPSFSEGRMSQIRAHVVSRAACAEVARELGLGKLLLDRARELGVEDGDALAKNRSTLAALLEAALAALFFEHAFDQIERPIIEAFKGQIEYAVTTPIEADAKTHLQERLAPTGRRAVYEVVTIEGLPHERVFTCAVLVDGVQQGVGTGRSKKEAEQQAAQRALEALGDRTAA
jgi:ribonuclease III